MGLFSKLFKRKKTEKTVKRAPYEQERDPARYEEEKNIIAENDVDKKRAIAASAKSHPEILFYLAHDEDVQTRREVAGNLVTPLQASEIISHDTDVDVRLILAERLVKLLPDLAADEYSQLYAHTLQALATLARDEVARVRVALSTALRDHDHAPPSIVKTLAMDVEREVAEPLLKYCAALSDEDLVEIISDHPEDWAVEAVSQRHSLSARVTEALFTVLDEARGQNLLKNHTAEIGADLLEHIVERSRDYISWQEPVALRPELSYKLAQQLVGFCEGAVMDVLRSRQEFDSRRAQELADLVSRRMSFMSEDRPLETLEQKVNRYASRGDLTEETLLDAVAWQEYGFVKLAMSRLSGIHQLIIEKIFASQSPKSITALCWYAGLPMRVSVELQKTLGRVPTQSILYARQGTDYPLPEGDMAWQLEFFGVEVDLVKKIDPENSASQSS